MKNLTYSKVREGGEKEVDLHLNILLSIIIGEHMKMFLFKFNRNQTITKNYFFEEVEGGKKGNPNSKFYYNLLLKKKHKNAVLEIRAKSHHKLTIRLFRGREEAVETGGPHL